MIYTQGRRLSVFLYQTQRDKREGEGVVPLAYQDRASGTSYAPSSRILSYKRKMTKTKPHITCCDHQSNEHKTDLLAPNQVPIIFVRVVPKDPSQYLDSGGKIPSEHTVPQRALQHRRGRAQQTGYQGKQRTKKSLHTSAKFTLGRLSICSIQ